MNSFIFTVIGSVISGLLIFALSQLLLTLSLQPYAEYKKIKSKIAYALTFYANIVYSTSKNDSTQEASKYFRAAASELAASIQLISFYQLLRIVRAVPSKDKIVSVTKALISLSNCVGVNAGEGNRELHENIKDDINTIKKVLKLKNLLDQKDE